MRTKEYVIFLLIFTVCYILFFIIYDKLSIKVMQKRTLKHAYSMIDIDKYNSFATFYGIRSNISEDVIKCVYNDFKNIVNVKISDYSNKYKISSYELVVIILYLEYFNLISKRNIIFENDLIINTTYIDQNLINKYYSLFYNKSDLKKISSTMGDSALNDINYLNSRFLVPGVRLINSTLYYVGDIK